MNITTTIQRTFFPGFTHLRRSFPFQPCSSSSYNPAFSLVAHCVAVRVSRADTTCRTAYVARLSWKKKPHILYVEGHPISVQRNGEHSSQSSAMKFARSTRISFKGPHCHFCSTAARTHHRGRTGKLNNNAEIKQNGNKNTSTSQLWLLSNGE